MTFVNIQHAHPNQSLKARNRENEAKRKNTYKTTIADIGLVLVQKGYALEQELNSQEDSMFKAIEIITSVNLKTKYPIQIREKTKGMKMTREEKRKGNTGREQMRRNKHKDAMDHMREIIRDKKLGTESQREKLEQVTVLQLVLDYVRTLPTATVSPRAPVMPLGYTAPEQAPEPAILSHTLPISQSNDLSTVLQIVAQYCPSSIELSTMAPIPSDILNSPQSPVQSNGGISLYSETSGTSTPGVAHIQSGSFSDSFPTSVLNHSKTTIPLMSEVPLDLTTFETLLFFHFLKSRSILQDIIKLIAENRSNELKKN